MSLGLILTPPLTGVMTDTFGWESCFYLVGSLTCVWFVLWTYLVYESPEEHPRISEVYQHVYSTLKKVTYVCTVLYSKEELTYLRANIKSTGEKKLPTAPYLEIIQTKGFWAFLLALVCSMWGNYTLWTSIPLYLNNIQHFSLKAVRNERYMGLPLMMSAKFWVF